MVQVVFKRLYPKDYTSDVSTRVSNALLVGLCIFPRLCFTKALPFRLGAIIGQLFVGLVCDRVGRKVALIFTTLIIVLGATLGTAAHGAHGSAKGLFWFLTFARGLTGIVRADDIRCVFDSFTCYQGVGGEYPASSTSASEAANEQVLSKRGPGGFPTGIVWRHLMCTCSVHHGNQLRPLSELFYHGLCISHKLLSR